MRSKDNITIFTAKNAKTRKENLIDFKIVFLVFFTLRTFAFFAVNRF